MKSAQHAHSKLGSGLLELPRRAKRTLAVLTDSALCVLTTWLAICLRFESWVSLSGYQWLAVVLSILLAIPLLSAFGFYQTVIRYAGKQTIVAALRAMGVYALIYSAVFTAYGFPLVPRTIGILQPLLLLISLALVRILASQLLSEQIASIKQLANSPAVLIYGAGNSGRQLAASIRMSGQSKVVGFLDDNAGLHHAKIEDVTVHPPSQLPALIEQYGVQTVLLAMPSLTRTRRNEIIGSMKQCKVAIRTLPSLNSIAQGKATETDLRDLDIEDLLGRDPVDPIPELLQRTVTGKTVLVTGAGGSIGGELCRQISRLSPKLLIMLDSSEFALYKIDEEIRQSGRERFPVLALLVDVQQREEIRSVIIRMRPDTIYHAAAYKHVPLVESNAAAGMRNNVLGTFFVGQAALEAGVRDMVLISTDKAVRPTNVMGASKRIAEMVLQAMAEEHPSSTTHFCIVRFGNVLGSSGSVLPKFREQIRMGGPVTVTHREVTRYFMTIPEAAQLVIQAASMPSTAPSKAPVYLLDMGSSVKIWDLASSLIQLSGLTVKDEFNPHGDVEIVATGLRQGEKLYEELLVSGSPQPTLHPKIFQSHEPHHSMSQLQSVIQVLLASPSPILTFEDAVVLLKKLDIGYSPNP